MKNPKLLTGTFVVSIGLMLTAGLLSAQKTHAQIPPSVRAQSKISLAADEYGHGNYGAAIRHLEEAKELLGKPTSQIQYYLVKCYAGSGDHEQARAALGEYFVLTPTPPQGTEEKKQYAEMAGMRAQGDAKYRQAVKDFLARRYKRAIGNLEATRVLRGQTTSEIQYYLVMSYYRLGDVISANHALQEYFSVTPSEPGGAQKKQYSEMVDLIARLEAARFVDFKVSGLTFTFAVLPAGSFMMGSPLQEPKREADEKQHQVTISRPFYLQTTEVTQGQWQTIMGNNPSNFVACGLDCPVEKVNWFEAIQFCNKCSALAGLQPAYRIVGQKVTWDRTSNGYRLPTEAEWEYAARAGTTTPFAFGSCLSSDEGNHDGGYPMPDCPRGQGRDETVAVGTLGKNAWGLHDMHGNVWEWCWDWYGPYPDGPVTDPDGPDEGSRRVNRGGSWLNVAWWCRSADRRDDGAPNRRNCGLGFRLARSPEW